MFVNPVNEYRNLALGIGLIILLAGAFGAGCTVMAWQKNAEIAGLKETRSNELAKQSKTALDDLSTASKIINKAATDSQVDISTLGTKLDALKKEVHNGKQNPLPPDCKLDANRLQSIKGAASAVNEAAFGLKPSTTLQTTPSP